MAGSAGRSHSTINTDPFEFDSDSTVESELETVSIFAPNTDDASTPRHRRKRDATSSRGAPNEDAAPAWVGPLLAKLAKIESSICKEDRRRKQPVVVPAELKTEVRHRYKAMQSAGVTEWNLQKCVTSEENSTVTEKLVKEVMCSQPVSKWSTTQVTKAAVTYLRSLRTRLSRQERGITDRHKRQCRRNNVLREKLARRQAAANRINYGQRSKERINQILNMDYMSSEETDDEADVDSTQPRTRAVRRRKVRQLPGESHQLKQLKTDLDTYYWTRIATPLGSAQRAHVVRPATLVSNRTIPQTPSWASNASDE